jgi:hypothetical protein
MATKIRELTTVGLSKENGFEPKAYRKQRAANKNSKTKDIENDSAETPPYLNEFCLPWRYISLNPDVIVEIFWRNTPESMARVKILIKISYKVKFGPALSCLEPAKRWFR